jgi:hypothetical protein
MENENALGFPLFGRSLEHRQMRTANTPGEPKLAEQLLWEVGVEPQQRQNRAGWTAS